MVVWNQDTSEGFKLEHATEIAEATSVEIFLLLIIICSIHQGLPFGLSDQQQLILSICPPKQSKGSPHSELTQF